MRYVPISLLEEGMALGQDVYDGMGRMLLAKHLILNQDYINGLDNQGFPGVYIDDEFSQDIEVVEIIRPEMKREALSIISNMFLPEEEDMPSQGDLCKLVGNIVESVLDNGDVMCNMLDIKRYDDYTYFHSVNVGILSAMVGSVLGLDEESLVNLTMAGMLHDVGKKFIPVEILNNPAKLTDEEKEVLRTHSRLGADFIRDRYNFPVYVVQGILQHHEWYDGTGYPLGRMGEEISLFGRIIAVVDVYDALTSDRPYRKAEANFEALEYLMGSGGRQFDTNVLFAFMQKIAIYPVGAQVVLSDGSQAVVMENYPGMSMRPKVKQIGTNRIINLAFDKTVRNLTITKLIMH